MTNYVNEQAFFDWYDAVVRDHRLERGALLHDVYNVYCRTHKGECTVPADRTVSGRQEKYRFTCDIIGCCGANTVYIYF